MTKVWATSENEAITADYLDMLVKELRGESYSKSEHCKELMGKIGRKKPAIHLKHRTISGVLEALVLPYVEGYKPLYNAQKSLTPTVQDIICRRPGLHDYLARTNAGNVLSFPDLESPISFEPPPTEHDNFVPDAVEGTIRIFKDLERPEAWDARNRRLGEAGEKAVFLNEKRRLNDLGRADLSERVEWTAKEQGDGFGFDVRSFFGSGEMADRELMLEVKTTGGPKSTPFYITWNELHVASEQKYNYRLIRLYNFMSKERRAAYELAPPLENHVELQPTTFRAKPTVPIGKESHP